MTSTDTFVEYELSKSEADELRQLAKQLRLTGVDPVTADFYDHSRSAVQRVPSGLRGFLERFAAEQSAAGLIRGLPEPEPPVRPTPGHWQEAARDRSTIEQEVHLALCAMLLGEPFTWATLQSGRLIQDVLPIAGDEKRQNGHSSDTLLEFHTEDGFHSGRCDFLLLMGLRNHDGIATNVASIRDVVLAETDRELLSRPNFHILPDDEHVRQMEALGGAEHPALLKMREMQRNPEPVAVLFGDEHRPYLRLDRPFMRSADGDPASEAALDRLVDALSTARRDVVVETNSVLVVNNHLAVHGRMPFTARYDGTDRWLKKLSVSRELCHSDTSHGTPAGPRVLF
ncbi:L-asparagine oxygenase [Streptomyces lavendulae subsp. lavendulae]|uniref:TauD/TfdA family dioxygenase n=1 Tax=Streptomyces lavendulae TaxID=1914 RepID=UPI0024A42419|nr:TauD/TfdA family dioxygenase [Streptomyces lavendulae]GLV84815.1 L-asparagine oxygenase [Streptomyces lavendulae subsp. lavendulae]